MSATAPAEGSHRRRGPSTTVLVDVATGLVLVALFAWMLADDELRAIPYHLIFFVVIVVYGFRVWPLPVTVVVLALVTVLTGSVWQHQHSQGDLDLAEYLEVLLMPMILIGMVWHARRRRRAQLELERQYQRERDRAEAESQFLREAAHAMRNPIAVARGYLELAEDGDEDDARAARDAVTAELRRIDRIAGQLLDVAAHPGGDPADRVGVDATALARAGVERWRRTAQRRWTLDVTGPATVLASPDRLADALDALMENALRFTGTGDRIGVVCRTTPAGVVLGVEDDGPGIREEDREQVFQRFWRRPAPDGSRGTGLGLAFVATVAAECGGTAHAAPAPGGGAFVYLRLPPAEADAAAVRSPDQGHRGRAVATVPEPA